MTDVLQTLSSIFSFMFVLGMMFNLGFSYSFQQILRPLQHTGFVVRMLGVNFLLVPLIAFILVKFVAMTEPQQIGFALLALSAGSPFATKLVEVAKGNLADASGGLILLLIGTVVAVPLILPLVLDGVEIDVKAIVVNMSLSMLLPLSVALLIHSRYSKVAQTLAPYCSLASSVGMAGAVVTLLAINWDAVASIFGSGLVIALIVFVVLSFLIGLLFSPSKGHADRAVFGFSTAQRNIAAAMVVAAGSFASDPQILIIIILGSLSMTFVLLLFAGEWGKRSPGNGPEKEAA